MSREIIMRHRKAMAARFCYSCHTPWAMSCEKTSDGWMVLCKFCGHVRVPAIGRPRDTRAASPAA